MGYQIDRKTGLTDAQLRVIDRLADLGEASPQQMLDGQGLTISKVMLHRHLKTLVGQNLIEKIGNPPSVYYRLREQNHDLVDDGRVHHELVAEDHLKELEFFAFAETGHLQRGLDAFESWFQLKQLPVLRKTRSKKTSWPKQVSQNFQKLLDSYCSLRREIETARQPNGLVDATDRYLSIHPKPALVRVFYSDFFSIPQFGKTLLGHLVTKAKVGDRFCQSFIEDIIKQISPAFNKLTSKYKFDAFLFVPHSLKRTIGLMDELDRVLVPRMPRIQVKKVFSAEAIPQKSISSLHERILNATRSNHIATNIEQIRQLAKVCIVDDAIGSNATIHAIAWKLKNINPQLSITAYAPVGSYKGFDVIQDI